MIMTAAEGLTPKKKKFNSPAYASSQLKFLKTIHTVNCSRLFACFDFLHILLSNSRYHSSLQQTTKISRKSCLPWYSSCHSRLPSLHHMRSILKANFHKYLLKCAINKLVTFYCLKPFKLNLPLLRMDIRVNIKQNGIGTESIGKCVVLTRGISDPSSSISS